MYEPETKLSKNLKIALSSNFIRPIGFQVIRGANFG